MNFGASIFPTTAASDLISAVTTALTDNLSVVLAVLGFSVGLSIVFRLFTKHAKIKL